MMRKCVGILCIFVKILLLFSQKPFLKILCEHSISRTDMKTKNNKAHFRLLIPACRINSLLLATELLLLTR